MLWAAGGAAHADAAGPCARFAWPLMREIAWFAAADLPTLAADGSVRPLPTGAFVAALAPMAQVRFARPPERALRSAASFGGTLAFGPLPAGLYQVTLSAEGWIDLLEAGEYRPEKGHTGVRGCAGLRKSVRFEVGGGPLLLQLSGVADAHVTASIARVDLGEPAP
ncbi:hypothetical protein [Chelatococcus reniformis]|uniref:Uncharacterized protein n=1 Tax=Chelatococcus reniformis TaxID=1494448 RepID=A0A916UR33_9HYPH|nr:hypothetical protein [Chelatococcus reniformis]GGC82601.1 hypothetical protein GCM10010994_45640 [Chelatococcus reniformis]